MFYISCVGSWTKNLQKIGKKFNFKPQVDIKSSSLEKNFNDLKKKTHFIYYEEKPIENIMINPYCIIDGPLWSTCEGYAKYKHLLLVAAGIGGTPFASILYSLLNDIKLNKNLNYEQIEFCWVVKNFSLYYLDDTFN